MSRVLVVDASVVVDLIGRFRPQPIEALLWAKDSVLAAPELLDVEVLQALRRLDKDKAIPPSRGDVVQLLRALRIRRYRHHSLRDTIWSLRKSMTAYDAAYVALASLLDATLVTRDAKLARAPGLDIQVVVP
ncbi:type II toxin-antitoxin system VapC family toxin [Wenzhouxiangella sp. XN24]|uniref:type II toxin-antitoxin system VapC family toxin n=1 Tax=Wenzhouxiangella sp. XN24 TaxID=2713569 RepID=UPI0013EC332E|nr:type II toxin-antitoxin system VapC family toxin [Wenzhouxiangella sp. XN24]NGX15824.1 type II toxin-antitoxin system VapC family toxin [Wenzhouxiangella sp. XN24]